MGWYGAPFFCTPEGWYGAHFFLKISFPPQPEAKKQKNWVVENRADTEPQKQVQLRRAPYQPYFFLGLRISSSNASHRRTDDWGQTFGKLSENHTGSLSAFRVPQKERHFSRGRRKKDFQKFAESLTQFAPRIPQKERFFFFFSMTPKNAPFRRMQAFRPDFQNLAEKAASRPRGQIARSLEKLAPNDPNWGFPPPSGTRVAHLDLSMYPPFVLLLLSTFLCMGGGGLCLFISRHRLFALISLVCCFWCCFLFDLFSFICFALGK